MNPIARIHFSPAQRIGIALGVLFAAAPASAQTSVRPDSMQPEPGVAYGTLPDFPLPKTILFSARPDEIASDAEEWSRRGVSAFFLNYVAREWSSDIWATDGKPWTIGASDETIQKTKRTTAVARCARGLWRQVAASQRSHFPTSKSFQTTVERPARSVVAARRR